MDSEACTSTTNNQNTQSSNQKVENKNIRSNRKTEGQKVARNEFDLISEKLRAIHSPVIDLKPIKYDGKFLGRYRLYVCNLATSVTKEDLENTFKAYGEVNDVFIQANRNFGFVRMDYYHNALRAKKDLHGSIFKERKMYISFSPQASVTVKHLSPSVTNELLHMAFSVFGEIETCFVVTDRRGKSTGEGVVDYVRKSSALLAKKQCTDKMFFVTSSLKPITIEDYVPPPDLDGLAEEQIRRSQNYFEDRELGPRFALPGSFEYDYAKRFKDLWKNYDIKMNMLKSEEENEERKLDMDVMRARYDHETERLKDLIRQREMEKERFRQKLEEQVMTNPKKDCHEIEDRKVDVRPNELFMHANQLSNILDNEEREIQEQWRIASGDYRSDYENNSYQERYYESNTPNTFRRKIPEVIVHCQKRQRTN